MREFSKVLMTAFLSLVMSVGSASAADDPAEIAKTWQGDDAFYRVYAGSVGQAVKLRIFLTRMGRDLDGFYYNVADRMPVAVHGEINRDGSMNLTEFPFGASDQSETTFGQFEGTLSADGTEISGRWKPPAGSRELRFYFKEDYSGGALQGSLCRMTSRWETRRGSNVISREKGAHFVQLHGTAPGVLRINAAIRAMVEGAFSRSDTRRATDIGVLGDRVSAATAPTLSEIHRGIKVAAPKVTEADYASSDIRTHNFAAIPILNEAGLVCIRCYWDEYTGGIHPDYWDKYVTFDVVTGVRLRGGDIFKEGHSRPVAALGAVALRKSWGLKPGAPLSDGVTFEANLTLNDNWFIHPGGIGYSYNPYEIGPFSAGFIRFALPWSQVREWMKPGSPALRVTTFALPESGAQ